MMQVIKQEWEITKTYIFDVALKEGLINLDWQDFETMARQYKPFVAVKVDESIALSELMEKTLLELRKNINEGLNSIIVAVAYKDDEIVMDEMDGIKDCISRLIDEHVDIIFGIQQSDDITNSRCVTVYAFH